MDNSQKTLENELEKIPEIIIRDNLTCIDNIPLAIQYGLCGRPSAMIARDICRNYKGEQKVFLEKEGNIVNARSIMGLMTLEANKDSRLNLSIETADSEEGRKEARRIALRIYSGLTTETDFYPYFERFEQKREG